MRLAQPTARRQPAAILLVDDGPRRQIMRQVAPRRPSPPQPAQGIEHLAQIVPALPSIGWEQAQIGGDELLFIVAHIGRIGAASRHTRSYHHSTPRP